MERVFYLTMIMIFPIRLLMESERDGEDYPNTHAGMEMIHGLVLRK